VVPLVEGVTNYMELITMDKLTQTDTSGPLLYVQQGNTSSERFHNSPNAAVLPFGLQKLLLHIHCPVRYPQSHGVLSNNTCDIKITCNLHTSVKMFYKLPFCSLKGKGKVVPVL
jgi:hypothetical protein